jgi:hypothetical protein
MAENLRYQRKRRHFDVLAAREKTHKKTCFFRYSATPPYPTAKPSWGWLRVGVRKPRLVLAGTNAARNEVTTKARAYWRGCAGSLSRVSAKKKVGYFFAFWGCFCAFGGCFCVYGGVFVLFGCVFVFRAPARFLGELIF